MDIKFDKILGKLREKDTGGGGGSGDVTGPGSSTDNAIARYDGATGKIIQDSGVLIDDDDNVSGAKEITISQGANDDLDTYKVLAGQLSSGVIEGGELSAGTLSTQFSISDGEGYRIDATTDPDNPVFLRQTWTGKTDITVTTPSNLVNWIYLDASGNVIQQATEPTPEQRRDYVVFGYVVSSNGVDLDFFVHHPNILLQPASSITDFMSAIGDMNISGNEYSYASTDLTIKRSAGTTFSMNSNIFNNPKDPHFFDTSVLDPVPTFLYAYSDGAGGLTLAVDTDIDPDSWDDGSGVLATIGPSNKWTIQRIAFSPITGLTVIQYGQTIYNSKEAAEAAIDSEGFEVLPNISPGGFRTSLVVKKGETDLSSSDTVFRHTGKFGYGIGNNSSGFGGQSLQDTYEISDEPEIITDATRGALSLKQGSGSDADDVIEVLNGAGTQKFAVDGNGEIVTSDNVPTAAIQDDAVTTNKIDDEAVTTAKLDDESVTNAKMADMAQYTLKLRNSGTGAPEDKKISSFTADPPTSGDYVLGERSTGQLSKYDVYALKNFTAGSMVECDSTTSVAVIASGLQMYTIPIAGKTVHVVYTVKVAPSGRGGSVSMRLLQNGVAVASSAGTISSGSLTTTVVFTATIAVGDLFQVEVTSVSGTAPVGLVAVLLHG